MSRVRRHPRKQVKRVERASASMQADHTWCPCLPHPRKQVTDSTRSVARFAACPCSLGARGRRERPQLLAALLAS